MSGKKAMVIEVIGGIVASVIIIAIIAMIFSAESTAAIDEANKKALAVFATELAAAQNSPLSGGEHSTGAWKLLPGKGIVYAILYVPSSFAKKVFDPLSWWNLHLSFKSKDELQKCTEPSEACLCLFKSRTSSCNSEYNIITVSAANSHTEERVAIEKWIFEKFEKSQLQEAEFLKCIPLMASGCRYYDAGGNPKPCIMHYESDSKPIVWMNTNVTPLPEELSFFAGYNPYASIEVQRAILANSKITAPLDFESIIMRVKNYAAGGGTYPQIDFIQSSDVPLYLRAGSDKNPCKIS